MRQAALRLMYTKPYRYAGKYSFVVTRDNKKGVNQTVCKIHTPIIRVSTIENQVYPLRNHVYSKECVC